MNWAAYILFGLLLFVGPLAAQTDAHLYSRGTNLERSELAQLETTTHSIDVAMYSFTERVLEDPKLWPVHA